MRVLWVTNDLPPRAGGIEQFVGSLLARVHPETTAVVGPAGGPDAAGHDRRQPYRTVRAPGPLLPTRAVGRLVREVAAQHRPDVVVLGAAWPLGELAAGLTRDLGVPVVALTHGLEAGMAGAGLGGLVRRATRSLAAVTTISDYTERRLAPVVAAPRLRRLPPGVDVDRFTPEGGDLRRRWGVPDDAPVVGCISRLVRRKGQDALLRAWPTVLDRHPQARLVLAGEGPLSDELVRQAGARELADRVLLPGRLAWEDLPAAHRSLDVFAMPARTRLGGLDVEGLGIVYLEAQACGVPAIAGRSGGAPEAVRDGETGAVVDGSDPDALARAVIAELDDPARRERQGDAGRRWVTERWSWDAIATTLRDLLAEVVDDAGAAR